MISVVIPAYNEEKYLGRTLESLVNQTTQTSFEVIVVDNNSTDKSAAVAQEFQLRLNLKVIKEPRQGRGAARDSGFSQAQGEIILGTEADTILPQDWIDKLFKNFDQTNIVAVTGTCTFDSYKRQVKLMDFFQPLFMRLYRLFFGHYWLSGFNFGIRKEIYKRVGGFKSDLKTLDDVELAARVNKLGKIVFIPDTPVLVSGRRFESGILRGLGEYVQSFWQLMILKKNVNTFSDVR